MSEVALSRLRKRRAWNSDGVSLGETGHEFGCGTAQRTARTAAAQARASPAVDDATERSPWRLGHHRCFPTATRPEVMADATPG